MTDYGIKISTPYVDVRDATTSQYVLNSKYPFMKLDTQSDISFQTINLLFINDPPEPSGTGSRTTTVYSFPHTLGYVPRVWALFQTVSILTSFNQTYFQDSGVIAATTINDNVTMFIAADDTDVSINVTKYNYGGGSANDLTGAVFKFTLFTFVDDIV